MADKNNPDRSRGNFGDLSPDDPFAELARLIAPDDKPARPAETPREDDLADELLREFERISAPVEKPVESAPRRQPDPPPPAVPPQPAKDVTADTATGFDDYSDDMLADELEMSMGQFDIPEPEPEPFVPDRRQPAPAQPHQAEPGFSQRPASAPEPDPFAQPSYGRAAPQAPVQPAAEVPLPFDEPAVDARPSAAYGGASFGEPEWRATVTAPVEDEILPVQKRRQVEPPPQPSFQPPVAAAEETRRPDEFDLDLDELAKELSDFELDDAALEEPPAAPEDPIEEAAAHRDDVFDPAALVSPDELPQPVTEMDLPDLPEDDLEQERLAAPAYEYGLDDDLDDVLGAEHGLANPLRQSPREPQQPQMSAAAGTAGGDDAIYDDDIESVLEDDFRRALSQSEAMRRQRMGGEADRDDELQDEKPVIYFGPLRGAGQLILGSLAFVGVIAVAVFLVYQFAFSGSGGDTPVVITADNSSVKEAPEDPGGEVVPNQDNPVFSRVTGEGGKPPTQDSLISSDQSPVDLDAAAPNPIADVADGVAPADDGSDTPVPDDTAADTGEAGTVDSSLGVATRKVRTIVVRPDGTLVERDASGGVGEDDVATPVPAAPETQATAETSDAGQTADAGQPVDTSTALEPAPVETSEPEAQPIDPNSVGFDLYNVPLPTPRSSTAAAAAASVAAAPAAAAPAAPAPAPAAPAPTSATPAGSLSPYAVQVASLPSEADAKKAYIALAAKYPSIFGGRSVEYQAAAIDGKGTYYRVRIPASSLNEAISLCEALKSQGGSCLVPR
ncbi:SPOR domain-containing protein [Martelella sp. HB161492]|uniref:SPOR domain-containing protein n=1 Tax=Martelella sp. HB161492 TaxID=2720726 RepID=UPI00159153FE|nr:SPOR domain-containing protein [Martelella sp. HB161492]